MIDHREVQPRVALTSGCKERSPPISRFRERGLRPGVEGCQGAAQNSLLINNIIAPICIARTAKCAPSFLVMKVMLGLSVAFLIRLS
jgi:hypothetical protein